MMNQTIYLLTRGQGIFDKDTGKVVGAFEYLGVYDDVENLKIAYQEETQHLEEDFREFEEWIDKRSVWSKRENYDRLVIHSFDVKNNIWDYELSPEEVFAV